MPRIPDSGSLGYSVARAQRTPTYADHSGEIMAEATTNLARTVAGAAERIEAGRASLEIARAKNAWQVGDMEVRRQLEEDPNFGTYETRYRDKMSKLTKETALTIRNRREAQAFEEESALALERGVESIRHAAKAKEADYGRASLQDVLSTSVNLLQNSDATGRDAILGNVHEAINGAAMRGYISQTDAQTVRQNWTKGAVVSLIKSKPAAERIEMLDSGLSKFVPADELLGILKQAQVEDRTERILQAFDIDAAAGDKALRSVSGLSEEQHDQVRAAVRERLNLRRGEAKHANVDGLAQLERAIARGSADAEDRALTLYRRNALSADEYANMIGQIERQRIANAALNAEAEGVADALSRGEKLDPASPAHRKWVDSALKQQDLEAGSPQWQAAALDLSMRTGIIPKGAQSWLRSAALSPNPETAAASASFLDTIAERSPQTLAFVDEKTKSFGMQVSDMVAGGTSMKTAVSVVRKNVFETTANERAELDRRYKAETKDSAAALRSRLDADDTYDPSVFGSAPTVPPGMQGDFDALTREYFSSTGGNLSSARSLAYRDLQSRWGRTVANGKPEIMRYAPERFGIPGELVRSQIAEQFGERAKNIRVVGDAYTGRALLNPSTGQVLPISYSLVEVDPQTGMLNVLPDRYVLPQATDIEAGVNQRRAQNIERAKRQSQANAAKARAFIEDASTFPIRSPAQMDAADMRMLRPAEVK